MFRIAKLISLITFLLTSASCFQSSPAQARKYPIPNRAFVKVYKHVQVLKCKKKKCPKNLYTASGSGASIKLDLGKNNQINGSIILTAAHMCDWDMKELPGEVTKIDAKITILDYTNSRHEVRVMYLSNSKNLDLCLLLAPNVFVPKITISKNAPEIGDRVIAMAAPGGVYHPPIVPIFEGIFSGEVGDDYSLTTIPAMGGSSGSAILNEKSRLVGVLFAVSTIFKRISLVTNYKKTISFISDCTLKIKKTLLEEKKPPNMSLPKHNK